MPQPHNSGFAGAKQALLMERDKLERQVAQLTECINKLDTMMRSSGSQDDIPPVKPGEYAGTPLGRAFESYIKARGGVKITILRAVEDLQKGGALFGSKQKPIQTLRITMQNKKRLVTWDSDWTMELAPTASEPPKPRVRDKKKSVTPP